MTTIDQRILIPASQPVVWGYLSDLSKNPDWQDNCRSVSFLSSKHMGVGTRWRISHADGHDGILEIISWYNGLGYEYGYVDGSPYKNANGRIRLQEIPEGTIVQWTFSFEGKSLFGGMRGGARQVETEMATSLKALYRQIKALPKPLVLASPSLMQDAPDVSGRSSYQPRHTTTYDEKRTLTPAGSMAAVTAESLPSEPEFAFDDNQPMPVVDFTFEEPEVAEFDTRPNPTAAPQDAELEQVDVSVSEPDFLDDALPAVELAPAIEPIDSVQAAEELLFAELVLESARSELSVAPEQPAEAIHDALATHELPALDADGEEVIVEALAIAAVEAEADPLTIEEQDAPQVVEIEAPEIIEVDAAIPEAALIEPELLPAAAVVAAAGASESHKSIWEVFGVNRPEAGSPSTTVEAPAEADDDAPVIRSRRGYRVTQRRSTVRVRYPE